MHTIDTSVAIVAPPQAVWDVLVDFASYHEWNPFVVSAAGEAKVGTTLTVEITPPGGKAMTHRPTVVAAEPGRRLEWLGTLVMPALFSARHEFVLEAGPAGDTLLRHREVFRGVLVPFLKGTLRRTEEGFHAMNRALAERVE